MSDHTGPSEQTAGAADMDEDAPHDIDAVALPSKDHRRAGHLAAWWRRERSRLQPDPRRWTALGWVNATYIVLAVGLALLAPREDDGSSPTFYLGLILLVTSRGGFDWWWKRRHRTGTEPDH
jgi:hypothetical protein